MLSTLAQAFGTEAQAVIAIFLGVWAGTLGLPVPEEIPLLSAGLLAAVGVIPLHVAFLGGFVACFSADVAVFAVGRRVGKSLNTHPQLRRIMRGRYLLRARHLYLRRGRFTLIVARLLPGLKMPFLFTAGAFRMPWLGFLGRDLLSLVVLVPVLVLFAYSSSLSIVQLAGIVREAAAAGLVVALVAAVVGLAFARAARKRRQDWRSRCVAAGMRLRAPFKDASLTESWD